MIQESCGQPPNFPFAPLTNVPTYDPYMIAFASSNGE